MCIYDLLTSEYIDEVLSTFNTNVIFLLFEVYTLAFNLLCVSLI